jgi:outer membrane protein TolC
MSKYEHWRETVTKICADLEQAKMLAMQALSRAEKEKERADSAERALRNFIALAPFAVPGAPEPPQRPQRRVDLWPTYRRPSEMSTTRRGREME